MEEKKVLALIMQLLSVVDYLHSKLIVHRDISANTILVDSSKESGIDYLQLMSFDNSIQLSTKKQLIQFKVSNQLPFISPEQFIGKYNRKVDEYSAGVLMYYLLSGQNFPF
jgi:serine/threonine-protein kinase